MAEHFTGYGAVPIDFSGIGSIPETYARARQAATRERVLSDLGKGTLDYGKASQALLAANDTEGGIALARLAEARSSRGSSESLRQQQFEFQKQEAARAQSNADRSFDFQKAQADAQAKGFDVREVDDPANPGSKILVRINRAEGTGANIPIQGAAPTTPQNPYAATGKLTEQQSKDRLFANRMIGAHGIINKLEGINEGAAGFAGGVLQNSKVPGVGQDSVLFNTTASPDRQRFVQAQRDFVNAVLRKESGAAINQSEFENARKQYFPMPGDSPEVIAQKRTNRQVEIEGLMAGAGTGYKMPEGYVGTKDKPQQAGAPLAPPKPGTVQDGYRYIGGDPGSQNSWKKI